MVFDFTLCLESYDKNRTYQQVCEEIDKTRHDNQSEMVYGTKSSKVGKSDRGTYRMNEAGDDNPLHNFPWGTILPFCNHYHGPMEFDCLFIVNYFLNATQIPFLR